MTDFQNNLEEAMLVQGFEDESSDGVRDVLADEESAYLYLLERWLTDATSKLKDARHDAGLTQEQVAQRIGTKQPAIARLEKDHGGKFSLRRFAEYALACGALPSDLVLESAAVARERAITALDRPSHTSQKKRYSIGKADVGVSLDCKYGLVSNDWNLPRHSYAVVHLTDEWIPASDCLGVIEHSVNAQMLPRQAQADSRRGSVTVLAAREREIKDQEVSRKPITRPMTAKVTGVVGPMESGFEEYQEEKFADFVWVG